MCTHPINRLSKYIKQLAKLKEEINKSAITVGNLNTLLLLLDGTSKLTTSVKKEDLDGIKHSIQQ